MKQARYQDHYRFIRPGDAVAFQGFADWHRIDRYFTGGSVGSLECWLIRWGSQASYLPWRLADYSHPEIACWHTVFGEPTLYVVGAVGAGVRPRRLSELIQTYNGRIFHFPLLAPPETGIAVARQAHQQTGGNYAPLWQFPLTGCRPIRRLWHHFGWNMNLGGWVCSEFFAWCYQREGFNLGENEFGEPANPWDLTPDRALHLPFFGEPIELVS